MSRLMAPMTIGEMIAWTTARNLEAEWGLVAHDRRLTDDVGADDPVRWQKVDKRNWLDAMLAAVVDAVRRRARAIAA